jgi:hypothetical protein
MSAQYSGSQASLGLSGSPRRKRKLGETGLEDEVADSEGEDDYGWHDDEEDALPSMPPQWQGSEDLLIGQHDGDGDRIESAESANESAAEDPDSDNCNDSDSGDDR